MATIQEIQNLLVQENKKLKEDLGSEIMNQVGVLLDRRLEAHEAKLLGQIQALQKRTEALEAKGVNEEGTTAGAAAAKRARSEPRTVAAKHELKPVVVLTGFPFNSRKKDLEAFVGGKLKEREDWKHLGAFAPSVRSSVVMVKMRSMDEVFDFIRLWKDSDIKFKDNPIRARADKTPEQRKANSKIYKVSQYLKELCPGKEVDPDFKRASVWIDEWQVVKLDGSADQYQWTDDNIQKAGVNIDREQAEKATQG